MSAQGGGDRLLALYEKLSPFLSVAGVIEDRRVVNKVVWSAKGPRPTFEQFISHYRIRLY